MYENLGNCKSWIFAPILTFICIPARLDVQLLVALLQPREKWGKVLKDTASAQLSFTGGYLHDIPPMSSGSQLHHVANLFSCFFAVVEIAIVKWEIGITGLVLATCQAKGTVELESQDLGQEFSVGPGEYEIHDYQKQIMETDLVLEVSGFSPR